MMICFCAAVSEKGIEAGNRVLAYIMEGYDGRAGRCCLLWWPFVDCYGYVIHYLRVHCPVGGWGKLGRRCSRVDYEVDGVGGGSKHHFSVYGMILCAGFVA